MPAVHYQGFAVNRIAIIQFQQHGKKGDKYHNTGATLIAVYMVVGMFVMVVLHGCKRKIFLSTYAAYLKSAFWNEKDFCNCSVWFYVFGC